MSQSFFTRKSGIRHSGISDTGSSSESSGSSRSGSSSSESSNDDVVMGEFVKDPDARFAFGFDDDDDGDALKDVPTFGRSPAEKKSKTVVRSLLLAPAGSMEHIQLLPSPPASEAPVKPNPILGSNSDNGLFTLASIIFHANIDTEPSLLQRHEKIVRTVKCPKNLQIISKTNIGFYENEHGFFPRTLLNILRNQRTATDLIKETVYISVATIDYHLSTKKSLFARPEYEQMLKQTYPHLNVKDIFEHIEHACNQTRELIKKNGHRSTWTT